MKVAHKSYLAKSRDAIGVMIVMIMMIAMMIIMKQ